MSLDVTIVSGMLGAGKTTYILRAASESLKNGNKTVVLVNDFGQAGIDGEVFSSGGLQSIELPSGCVCCALRMDLITTLKDIAETHRPEKLFIEPSGVASPTAVIDALGDASLKAHPSIISILDATEFPEFYESGMYGGFLTDQLKSADIILVNKSDLAGEALACQTALIAQRENPSAIVSIAVKGRSSGEFEPVYAPEQVIKISQKHPPVLIQPENHPAFQSISIRPEASPELHKIRSFFECLKKGQFGKALRAKALVNTSKGPYRFDFASGRVTDEPLGKEASENRVVVIGTELKKPEMAGYFGSD